MRKVILLCFSIYLCILLASASGVRQQISNIGSFRFPAAPTQRDVSGLRNYVYSTDTNSYLVQIKPVTKGTVVYDSATLASFYGGTVKGVIRGAQGSLISSKQIHIGSLTAQQIEYIKGREGAQPISVMARILLVNDQVLIASFITPYEQYAGMTALRDSFFNSFSLSTDTPLAQLHARSDTSTAAPVESMADSAAMGTTPDTLAGQPLPHLVGVHTELVNSNTLHFVVSFAVSILLLALVLYALIRWKKRTVAKQ